MTIHKAKASAYNEVTTAAVYDYMRQYLAEISRMIEPEEDGFTVTVGGNDEEDCMQRLIDLQEKHGDLTWYSGYVDQDYAAGEYIGRENFY